MAGRRKNGEGTVRLRSDGRWEGRYIVGYCDNGTAITKNVLAKSRTECIKKLKELKDASIQITGKLPTHARSSMTFGEWIDLWYQNYSKPSVRESTQEGYEASIYKHIIPEIGHIQLDKLSQNDLQQFYTRLKKNGRNRYTDTLGSGLSDRSIRACHARCRMALEKAVNEGLIYKNPAVGCKLPPKKSREMQVLSPDELQRFLIQAKHDGYYEIFMLDIATGLRRGELMGLQWDDINMQTGELHVCRQVSRVRGQLIASEPKTKTSIRTIIIPQSVIRMLSEYRETVDSNWVFPSPVIDGAPRDPQTIYHKMQKVLERAECKKVRFHDLRHTFATLALARGMDVKTLSATIGHISSATTLDIYSHFTDEMRRMSAEKIERNIGRNETLPAYLRQPPPVAEKKQEKQPRAKFEPYKGKIRRSGSGGMYQINENLWEGSYTPTLPNGKRHKYNVYAKTQDECEVKLQELIVRVKEEIAAEKQRIQEQSM